ncbi:MAG: helix-hairpin-helix domain-containing protein, partial [Candidatus Thorarchaeota archaeon]
MSFNLSDIKGLGKKEDTLKEAGIDSVEKLANASIVELTALKGIGKATAEKIVENAKNLLNESTTDKSAKQLKEETIEKIDEEKAQDEIKKLEEKKKKLQDKKVEEGDFVLIKITGRTQKGMIFRVSSEEDAKKAGIYDENKA